MLFDKYFLKVRVIEIWKAQWLLLEQKHYSRTGAKLKKLIKI